VTAPSVARGGTSGRAVPLSGVEAGRRALWVLAGLAGALGWIALRSGLPWESAPVCFLRETFHIGCATCGFTRALAALVAGDLVRSFVLHPLAPVVVLEAVVAWVLWGIGVWRGGTVPSVRWMGRVAGATVVAGLVVWIVRLVTGTIPV